MAQGFKRSMPDDSTRADFFTWLEGVVAADGRSHRAIETAHRLPHGALHNALALGHVPYAAGATRLAAAFGADRDAIAALVRPNKVVEVRCPACGRDREVPAKGRVDLRQGADGRIYGSCRRCERRRLAKTMRLGGLASLAAAAATRIVGTGATTQADRDFVAWLREAGLPFHNAAFIVDKAAAGNDPRLKSVLGQLWREQMARAYSDDAEQGKAILLRRLREGERATQAPRVTRAHILGAHQDGTFGLCPLCWLLVYRPASSVKGPRIWHKPCVRAWRSAPPVRAWLSAMTAGRHKGLPAALFGPMPLPPPVAGQRRPASAALGAKYRALIQYSGGKSTAAIAAAQACTEQAIAYRIKMARSRLPAEWGLVFARSTDRSPNAMRQQLCPLPAGLAASSQARGALVSRLADLGVSAELAIVMGGLLPDRHAAGAA